ncbi:hypothetical protein DV737_g640, partial [Chaetothyriales sp. CBS 132003]
MVQHTSPRPLASFSFEDVILKGLPNALPQIQDSYLDWKDLPSHEVAFNIMRVFIDPLKFQTLTYYRHLHLLELFPGLTFAFKDVALRFLGNLFEYFLSWKNKDTTGLRHHLTVMGATSGDPGSAAIYGLRNKKDVSIFLMLPMGKVLPVQELQMTTVLDLNVHCVSVTGVFDNCQDYLKQLFADPEANRLNCLGAVNSINWARILAQIPYYFTSYFQLLKSNPSLKKAKYAAPTGNFGSLLDTMPSLPQFLGLEKQEKKAILVPASAGLADIRDVITKEVDQEKHAQQQQKQ